MNVLNLYYSETGNTEKVALRIEAAVRAEGHEATTLKAAKELKVDLLVYDFVFVGSGVYLWLPGKPMLDFLRGARKHYADSGSILLCSPRLPGKKAVMYCTYAGVHTGIGEAIPAVKFCGQLFDHLGFTVIDEWYFIGDFKTDPFKKMNRGGRFGNIAGRPDEKDLQEVEDRVRAILKV
ncbi:MAG: flavodoxin [Deltaproteobacteria bacterium]|nr:flavodoxin [Deltaproteobacteria bacterium]